MSASRQPLSRLERLALVGLVAQQVFVLVVAPASPFANLAEPVYFASVASLAVTIAIVALRFRVVRDVRLEKVLLAGFLAGMPVIYTMTAIQRGESGEVISMEGTAILVFGVLAVVGVIGSPWFLVGGLAGHGLLWDAWHHATAVVVPGWYALGCLIVDVAFAAWAATQVRVYAVRSYRHRNVTEGR